MEFPATKQVTEDETGQLAPICPFHHFKNEMLPKHIQQGFSLHCRYIFEVMEACPGLDLADEDSFERGITILKSRVELCFQEKESKSNRVGAINVVKAYMAFEYREAWDRLQQSCFADRNEPLQQAMQNGYIQTKKTTVQPQA
jgi:hypothetical protein